MVTNLLTLESIGLGQFVRVRLARRSLCARRVKFVSWLRRGNVPDRQNPAVAGTVAAEPKCLHLFSPRYLWRPKRPRDSFNARREAYAPGVLIFWRLAETDFTSQG